MGTWNYDVTKIRDEYSLTTRGKLSGSAPGGTPIYNKFEDGETFCDPIFIPKKTNGEPGSMRLDVIKWTVFSGRIPKVGDWDDKADIARFIMKYTDHPAVAEVQDACAQNNPDTKFVYGSDQITTFENRLNQILEWMEEPGPNKSPVAVISRLHDEYQWGHAVAPTPEGSYDPDGTIVRRTWSVDGIKKGEPGFQETLTREIGEHEMCLEVEDNDGATDRTCETYKVVGTEPRIDIRPAITEVEPGKSTCFHVKYYSKGSGEIESVKWFFDANQVATGEEWCYTFTELEAHTITVEVTNSAGLTASNSITISVEAPSWFEEWLESLHEWLPRQIKNTLRTVWMAALSQWGPTAQRAGQEYLDAALEGEDMEYNIIGAAVAESIYTRADKIADFPDWADRMFGEIWHAIAEGRKPNWETFSTILITTARGEIQDQLEERGLTAEQIGHKIGVRLEGLESDIPGIVEATLDTLGVTPQDIDTKIEKQVVQQLREWGIGRPPPRTMMASFVYRIDDEWYEEHGYDPEGKPHEVHIPTVMYSNFFNAIAWKNPGQLPSEWNTWVVAPYENRQDIYNTLDIDMDQFELEPYEEELFMRRSFNQIRQTAAGMQGAVVNWLVGSVDEWEADWQEIVMELSDLLRPPITDILKDMGFIVPPNVKEQWATVPEALDALQTISTFLDNIAAVTPDQLEELDDETQALIERLQELQAGEEEPGPGGVI